jgi:hypothetical protein
LVPLREDRPIFGDFFKEYEHTVEKADEEAAPPRGILKLLIRIDNVGEKRGVKLDQHER